MDEVIDSVREYFEKNFGTLSKQSSRSTQLKNGAYFNYKNIGQPRKLEIDIGFMWWWEDEETVYLSTRLWIPLKTSENKKIAQFFKSELKDWEVDEWEDAITIGNYLNVNEIVATKEEQIPEMIKFLKESIDILIELKKKNKEIFK